MRKRNIRKFTKWISALLCAVLALSAVGCGGSAQTQPTATPEPTLAPTPTPTDPAEPTEPVIPTDPALPTDPVTPPTDDPGYYFAQ